MTERERGQVWEWESERVSGKESLQEEECYWPEVVLSPNLKQEAWKGRNDKENTDGVRNSLSWSKPPQFFFPFSSAGASLEKLRRKGVGGRGARKACTATSGDALAEHWLLSWNLCEPFRSQLIYTYNADHMCFKDLRSKGVPTNTPFILSWKAYSPIAQIKAMKYILQEASLSEYTQQCDGNNSC